MPGSDLARETADLLSVANASEPRSLNQLLVLATRQVPACSAATAGIWRAGELVVLVASHPDLPELIEAQLSSGRGPVLDALAGGGPVSCPDTLGETRWIREAGQAQLTESAADAVAEAADDPPVASDRITLQCGC